MAATEQPLQQLTGTVLVVDDDDDVRRRVCDRLVAEGIHAVGVADGLAALEAVSRLSPDLVVLDLDLPGLSGFEVLRRLQAKGRVPVILLSGLDSDADRLLGLEMGADDYVTKPFSGRELAVRSRNMLRRAKHQPVAEQGEECYRCMVDGFALVVDFMSRKVSLSDEQILLTPREFDLLSCFVHSPRRVFTKPQLLKIVWDAEVGWVGESTVTEHVRRLRTKLVVSGAAVDCIDTLWGVGYRFEPDA